MKNPQKYPLNKPSAKSQAKPDSEGNPDDVTEDPPPTYQQVCLSYI